MVFCGCDTCFKFVFLDLEEEDNDLEDSGYAEASDSIEQEENWEANVWI